MVDASDAVVFQGNRKIEQYTIIRQILQLSDRLILGGRLLGLMIHGFNPVAQFGADIFLVVDDEYAFHESACCPLQGRLMVTVVPAFSSLSICMRPSCACTYLRQIGRP